MHGIGPIRRLLELSTYCGRVTDRGCCTQNVSSFVKSATGFTQYTSAVANH